MAINNEPVPHGDKKGLPANWDKWDLPQKDRMTEGYEIVNAGGNWVSLKYPIILETAPDKRADTLKMLPWLQNETVMLDYFFDERGDVTASRRVDLGEHCNIRLTGGERTATYRPSHAGNLGHSLYIDLDSGPETRKPDALPDIASGEYINGVLNEVGIGETFYGKRSRFDRGLIVSPRLFITHYVPVSEDILLQAEDFGITAFSLSDPNSEWSEYKDPNLPKTQTLVNNRLTGLSFGISWKIINITTGIGDKEKSIRALRIEQTLLSKDHPQNGLVKVIDAPIEIDTEEVDKVAFAPGAVPHQKNPSVMVFPWKNIDTTVAFSVGYRGSKDLLDTDFSRKIK